jgi:hypothetical protein
MPILNMKLTVKLFDNFIIAIFFLFIPFTYALTVNLGFPLKISEVSLFVLFSFILYSSRFKIYTLQQQAFLVISLFVLITGISVLVNLLWVYPYQLNKFVSRFGYKFDSMMKYGYLLLAYFAFIVSTNAFSINQPKYIRFFIWGALLASFYSWYLFMTSLLGLPYILLPGMQGDIQVANLSFGTVIRCGTFKEGNFMGLFLLVAAIFSFYTHRTKTAYFFLTTILTTMSSMAMICGTIFLFLFYFNKFFTKRNLYKLFISAIVVTILFSVLLQNKDFNYLVTSKLFGNTSRITNTAEFSKADRINSIITAFKIGINNPVFGVGLSNYALHQKEYNVDARFFNENLKSIPNNIYLEIFCEIGLTGLLLFVYFLYLMYNLTAYDPSKIIKYGFLSTLVYFIAFPTFTILFIWVFWGLIVSLPYNYATNNS